MKKLNLSITNVQNISDFKHEFNFENKSLQCLVGKNGVGKTTLIKAIANLKIASVFGATSAPFIFNSGSKIEYKIDEETYTFSYNDVLDALDSKDNIDNKVKDNILFELPIPHGERFKEFEKLGRIDAKLRTKIVDNDYEPAEKLSSFLQKIYKSDKFNDLKEVELENKKYYFLPQPNDRYIREDYLSSGEFFVISLFKIIQQKKKLIVIDEIDISLDASAQVNLLEQLRLFCKEYKINILFTTQSLALMKTFSKKGEPSLLYMTNDKGRVELNNQSYNYVKSVMYGFKGKGKIILVEDGMLKKYIEFLLKDETELGSNYKIIFIGGASNTVDLMKRNETECFLSDTAEDVITVLDGDRDPKSSTERPNKQLQNYIEDGRVLLIPFESVEKKLLSAYYENDPFTSEVNLVERLPLRRTKKAIKAIKVYENCKKSDEEIFEFINSRKQREVNTLRENLVTFLQNSEND